MLNTALNIVFVRWHFDGSADTWFFIALYCSTNTSTTTTTTTTYYNLLQQLIFRHDKKQEKILNSTGTFVWKQCYWQLVVRIMWPPANQITQNLSSDSALNCLVHTLSCSKFLRAHFLMRKRQNNSDSWAQEPEDYELRTKT